MADPEISPISQLLNSLGITREDLNKRSDQMRQFLTAQDAISLRVLDRDNTNIPTSGSELRSSSKTSTSTAALARSVSCASSSSLRDASPPVTPVKSEPHETGVPLRHFDSMEMVIERQRRQNRREKKGRKDKERDLAVRMTLPRPHSPSPSNASQPGFSLDSFMQLRDDRRVPAPGVDDTAQTGVIQVCGRVLSRVFAGNVDWVGLAGYAICPVHYSSKNQVLQRTHKCRIDFASTEG